MVPKKNCWEYKKCDREPGGDKAEELGVCPAVTEKRLDGDFFRYVLHEELAKSVFLFPPALLARLV